MEKGNENKGNVLYVLNTLKKYSDDEHILSSNEIRVEQQSSKSI